MTEASKAQGLFSRTYAAATASFAAVMFLTGFAALAVVPTLPTAARDLAGVSLFPVVAGCFVTASLLGGVLGGHWADRSGARRPLAAGVVLTVVTLVVSGASTSIWQLAAGRFLDGLAAGMVAVSVDAAIGQAYPERLRPRALHAGSSRRRRARRWPGWCRSGGPGGGGRATSSAMQTSQNLGQVTVMALAFAALNTCVAAGASATAGYGAAFGLLLLPPLLIALLAGRARSEGGRVVAAAHADEPSLTRSGSD